MWGMEAFAEWLRPAVPEVPVEFIPSGEPFYVPPLRGYVRVSIYATSGA
jgi:hypothetical protein